MLVLWVSGNYFDNVMFYFFSVSFPGLSVQDRLSVSEARPEPGRRESRPWQTRPFAFAHLCLRPRCRQGDMPKHDIVKVVTVSAGKGYSVRRSAPQA